MIRSAKAICLAVKEERKKLDARTLRTMYPTIKRGPAHASIFSDTYQTHVDVCLGDRSNSCFHECGAARSHPTEARGVDIVGLQEALTVIML